MRIEHIRRLTLRQVRWLRQEADKDDIRQQMLMADAMRVAFHANGQIMGRWMDEKREYLGLDDDLPDLKTHDISEFGLGSGAKE